MKEIQISLWEMTKEEAACVPRGNQYLIYNPILRYYRVETSGRHDIAKSNSAISSLKYFSFDGVIYKNDDKSDKIIVIHGAKVLNK